MIIFLSILLFSIFSLSFAYISEFFFGLEPCILCLYQRIPFFVNIFLAFIGLFLYGKKSAIILILCGLVFLSGASIAFYHVGVEKGVFSMTSGCTDNAEVNSLDDLKKLLDGKPNVPCNEPQFVFLGISMAGYNFFISAIAALFSMIYGFKAYRFAQIYNETQIELEKIENEQKK